MSSSCILWVTSCFMAICFANHWAPYSAHMTGYGAVARRLWTTLPTVQFSHAVISTLVAVKVLCQCPTASFPVLCAWPYGPVRQWDCSVIQESISESALSNYIHTFLLFLYYVFYWAKWMDWCMGQWTVRVGVVVVVLQLHQERGSAWSLGCGLIMFALYAAIFT